MKERILHCVGTILWGITFAGVLNLLEFHGYFVGYTVGIFLMMYFYVGLMVIENHELSH